MKSWCLFIYICSVGGAQINAYHEFSRGDYILGQGDMVWLSSSSSSSEENNNRVERDTSGDSENILPVIQFCCDRHFYLAMVNSSKTCLPSGKLLDPQFHNQDGQLLAKDEVSFSNVSRMNACSSFILPKSDFKLLMNGQMMMKGGTSEGLLIPSQDYCLLWMEGNQTYEMSALVCFPDDEMEESNFTKVMFAYILPVSFCISALFLAATFVVYCLVDDLRNDLLGKSFMCSIAALFFAKAFGAIAKGFTHSLSLRLCVTLAMLMHFGFLNAFFWLNVISLIVFISICFQGKYATISRKKWFTLSCIYAFGLPVVLTTIILIHDLTSHLDNSSLPKPGFGEISCGFSNRGAQVVYFYGPISFLIGINLVLFCASACWLYILSKRTSVFTFQFTHYLKLLLLMGIPWIFESLSFFFAQYDESFFITILWTIFDVFNALQGVIIFIVFVCRKAVLARVTARICGASRARRRYPDVFLPCSGDEPHDGLTEDLRSSETQKRAFAKFDTEE